MTEYKVYITATVEAAYTLEADSAEEAEEKVFDEFSMPSLCSHCSSYRKANHGADFVDIGDSWDVVENATHEVD